MLTTEKGLTKLVEVATFVRDIRPKLKADEELTAFLTKYRDNKQNENGEVDNIDFLTALLPIIVTKYRDELYRFLSIWNEKDVEEIKNQPFATTLKEVFDILKSDDLGELKAFF